MQFTILLLDGLSSPIQDINIALHNTLHPEIRNMLFKLVQDKCVYISMNAEFS